MLENYYKDLFGIVHQKQIKEFKKDYATQYDGYGELSNYMAYLRYGFISGVIPHRVNSILDVGYGNGAFLNVCKDNIKNCYGYDISDTPVPEGCTKLSTMIGHEGNLLRYCEVVTFFDSLEHFSTIEFIKDLPCSYIVVSVPNCKREDDDAWFETWKHRREDEHLHHFNLISIKRFFDYAGWDLIKSSYLEDTIRKSDEDANILTVIFKRK